MARQLGFPLINIDAHQDTVYENIAIACEMFTKFAGYTQEYLIFDSSIYVNGVGIRLDQLFTLTPYLSSPTVTRPRADSAHESLSASLSAGEEFKDLTNDFPPTFIVATTGADAGFDVPVAWEDLIGDWRKVMSVWSFEEGSSSGINTLFTIEQSLAQQTYFSYAMGNYGFDLVSWYVLKNWLDIREKVLAIKRDWTFDERTQTLQMYPAPSINQKFYGAVGCYVEKPLRDVVKEMWVLQYALALTKMSIARVRGKFSNVALFGGGTLNAADLLGEGKEEKTALEEQLYTNAPGLGDNPPPMFFVG
jgi:hypothetical protein